MKVQTVFILVIAYFIGGFCKHFIKGYFRNVSAIYHTVVKVEFHGVSCRRKYKTVAFHDYNRNRLIGGIIAYDNLQSKAIVKIVEGGLGFDHVHLRLKSQRGWGLDYDIAIYGAEVEIFKSTTTISPMFTTTAVQKPATREPVSVAIARVILRSQYIKDLEKEHLI